jgi:hypothetical protein
VPPPAALQADCKQTAFTRVLWPAAGEQPFGRQWLNHRVQAAHDGTRCHSGRVAMQKVEGSSPFIRF